jgi:hypothetical protein
LIGGIALRAAQEQQSRFIRKPTIATRSRISFPTRIRIVAKAEWLEFRLFCPVCNVHFTQLVVLHKLPKNFKIEPYLAGMVESHDHKAVQEAQAKKDKP